MAASFLMVSQVRYPKFPAVSLKMGPANALSLLLILSTVVIFLWVDSRILLPVAVMYLVTGLLRHLNRIADPEYRAAKTKI